MTYDDANKMRFMLPPETRRDKATARLANGMEQVKNWLKTIEWLGLGGEALAGVKERYNAVAREADGLCDRRLSVKRHERRARAIVQRARAVHNRALVLLVDDMAVPDRHDLGFDIGLGPQLRDVERAVWLAPLQATTYSNWADSATATPYEDLLALRDRARQVSVPLAGINWVVLNYLLLLVGYHVPPLVLTSWTVEQAREAETWALMEYTRLYINSRSIPLIPRPAFLEGHEREEKPPYGE